jgi:hypothetical protein
MSSEKHPNLQLHKWAPTDYVKREEWNENFGIIDDKIGILNKKTSGFVNVKEFGAIGDGVTDDTTAIQNAVNSLSNGSILYFPAGTYLIGQINFKPLQRVLIAGKGTIQAKAGDYEAYFNIPANTYYLEIKGLTFRGLKGIPGAPTTYTPDKNILIKTADGCGYITIEGNTFIDHMGHFMSLGAVSGNDMEYAYTIQNNVFRNMEDLNDNRQCALLLRNNFQYSNIVYNKFYNCKSAIHCFGANNRINYNTVSGATLNIVGTPSSLNDYFTLGQAHIVCIYSGDPLATNSAKIQIIGNKMNHLNGNAPVLLCVSSLQRNECYFDISHNEMLVNTSDYNIMLKQNNGTRIVNNSMGTVVSNAHKAHIAILESKGVILDKNHFIGEHLTAILEGADFYEGENSFDKKSLGTKNYEYRPNATITNARRPRVLNYTFMGVSGSNAGFTGQHTVKSWTWTKNAVGHYTVTHNIGHTYYTVNVSAFQGIACVKNLTENSFDIYVYNLTNGTLRDDAVSGVLTLTDNRHGGYYNLETIPELMA